MLCSPSVVKVTFGLHSIPVGRWNHSYSLSRQSSRHILPRIMAPRNIPTIDSRDRDSSNILRASVLDVFRDLGALEDNSVVKAWILQGPNTNVDDMPLDIDSLGDIDDEPTTPKAKINFNPESAKVVEDSEEEAGSGDETDSGRNGRSGFRNAISRPFRLRSKSRTKTRAKSKTREDRRTASSADTDDEGYTSSSSISNKLRKKKLTKPLSPTGDQEVSAPPVPALNPSANQPNALTRFFRAPKASSEMSRGALSRKASEDLSLSPQSSRPSRVVTPESRLTPTVSKQSSAQVTPKSSDSGHDSRFRSKESPPSSLTNTVSKRISFIIPSAVLPSSTKGRLGARRGKSSFNLKRLSIKPSTPEPSSFSSKSAPSSPFLLVAPYGGEDAMVDGDSGSILAQSIDDSTKANARNSLLDVSGTERQAGAAPATVIAISISKTARRQTIFIPDNDTHDTPKSLRRKGSLDSQLGRIQLAATGVADRPVFTRGKTVPFPVKPVLALVPARLVPPPILRNPDASRFGEMDLEE